MAEPSETTYCSNCKGDIRSAVYQNHEVHCRKHVVLCKICDEPIPIREEEEHFKEFHAPVQCELCGARVPASALNEHKEKHCPERAVLCPYCQLQVKFRESDEHQEGCGSRTDVCELCNQRVILREMAAHKLMNCNVPKPAKLDSHPRGTNSRSRQAPGDLNYEPQDQSLHYSSKPPVNAGLGTRANLNLRDTMSFEDDGPLPPQPLGPVKPIPVAHVQPRSTASDQASDFRLPPVSVLPYSSIAPATVSPSSPDGDEELARKLQEEEDKMVGMPHRSTPYRAVKNDDKGDYQNTPYTAGESERHQNLPYMAMRGDNSQRQQDVPYMAMRGDNSQRQQDVPYMAMRGDNSQLQQDVPYMAVRGDNSQRQQDMPYIAMRGEDSQVTRKHPVDSDTGAVQGTEVLKLPCEFCNQQFPMMEFLMHQVKCQIEHEKPVDVTGILQRASSPDDLGDIMMQCRHCMELFPQSYVKQHEIMCSQNPDKELLNDVPSGHIKKVIKTPPPMSRNEENLLPCEFCNQPFPFELLEHHQIRCEQNSEGPFNSVLGDMDRHRENRYSPLDLSTMEENPRLVTLPCEFCHQLFPFELLGHHQILCEKELHEFDAIPGDLGKYQEIRTSPPPPYVDDSTTVPCEFCKEPIQFEMLVAHQALCGVKNKNIVSGHMRKEVSTHTPSWKRGGGDHMDDDDGIGCNDKGRVGGHRNDDGGKGGVGGHTDDDGGKGRVGDHTDDDGGKGRVGDHRRSSNRDNFSGSEDDERVYRDSHRGNKSEIGNSGKGDNCDNRKDDGGEDDWISGGNYRGLQWQGRGGGATEGQGTKAMVPSNPASFEKKRNQNARYDLLQNQGRAFPSVETGAPKIAVFGQAIDPPPLKGRSTDKQYGGRKDEMKRKQKGVKPQTRKSHASAADGSVVLSSITPQSSFTPDNLGPSPAIQPSSQHRMTKAAPLSQSEVPHLSKHEVSTVSLGTTAKSSGLSSTVIAKSKPKGNRTKTSGTHEPAKRSDSADILPDRLTGHSIGTRKEIMQEATAKDGDHSNLSAKQREPLEKPIAKPYGREGREAKQPTSKGIQREDSLETIKHRLSELKLGNYTSHPLGKLPQKVDNFSEEQYSSTASEPSSQEGGWSSRSGDQSGALPDQQPKPAKRSSNFQMGGAYKYPRCTSPPPLATHTSINDSSYLNPSGNSEKKVHPSARDDRAK